MKRSQVAALLDQLADNPVEVLTEAGIRGYRFNSCACPVANWLEAQDVPGPLVAREEVTYGNDLANDSSTVELPSEVTHFIDAFDEGRYPELEIAS